MKCYTQKYWTTPYIKKLKSRKKYIKVLISSTVKTHIEVLINNLIIHITLNNVVTQINNISLKSTANFFLALTFIADKIDVGWN